MLTRDRKYRRMWAGGNGWVRWWDESLRKDSVSALLPVSAGVVRIVEPRDELWRLKKS